MPVLYVASDQPGAGKTAFCAAVAHLLKQQGVRASVFKPLSAAAEADPDAAIYHRLLGQPETGWPRAIPKGGVTTSGLKDIEAASAEMLGENDLLLVEASSEVSAEDSGRLLEALDAKAVVMARYRPDIDISHLSEWRAAFGERLIGFVINSLTRYKGTDLQTRLLPAMNADGLHSLGIIPEDRRLLGITVGRLASALDGRFIAGEENADALVEHFLVGGLGLDNGVAYFGLRDNKAVIVRGDRPDIQMAALQTPTACMLITKGVELIEYVQYEAEQNEVPVILVEADTLSTMAFLDTALDGARFDHPAKLDRSAELLKKHVDLASIYSALGIAA